MAEPNKDALNKEDLYLLLESYKNSVEMNTLISQQLTSISDALTLFKDDFVGLDVNIQKKLDNAMSSCGRISDKIEAHEKESIKSHSKIFNKINLLYVGIGSIVLGIIVMAIQLIGKYEQLIHTLTTHMGVQ
jgi:hypothetical protein